MARLEIAAETLDDALAAAAAGADSVEVCAALALGGLTPRTALVIEIAERAALRVYAIVRPHADGFRYDAAARREMLSSARELARIPRLAGLVVGAWDAAGRIDVAFAREVRDAAGGLSITTHRALDFSAAPEAALEELAGAGFTRVLTAGPAPTVWDARAALAGWIARFGPRLDFVASGGITLAQLPGVLAAVRPHTFHFGGAARSNGAVAAQNVSALRAALDAAS